MRKELNCLSTSRREEVVKISNTIPQDNNGIKEMVIMQCVLLQENQLKVLPDICKGKGKSVLKIGQ